MKQTNLLSILKNIPIRNQVHQNKKEWNIGKAARVEAADVEAEETPSSTFRNKDADIDTVTEEVASI